MAHCRQTAGKWYRGILEAGEQFIVRWHEADAEMSRQRRGPAVGGVQGNSGRGGQQVECQEN